MEKLEKEEILLKLKQIDSTNVVELLKIGKMISAKCLNNDFKQVKIAIIASYSTQYIKIVLKTLLLKYEINAEIYEGIYNGINKEILDSNSELYSFNPDFVIVLTNSKDVIFYPNLLSTEKEILECVKKQIDYYKKLWDHINTKIDNCTILQTNFVLPMEREIGNLEANYLFSKRNFLNILNLELAKAKEKNVLIIDNEYLASYIGKENWFDYTNYYIYKAGFNINYIGKFVECIINQIKACIGNVKKCLVLDLDNTIWGGVVGDDGVDGIVLDPNNPIGEAYRDFQKYVKKLKERGVILAACSKNNEEIARKAFENKFMILKLEDFSCFIANWDDKVTNIKKISYNLNIGIDSLVFFDDNPVERLLIKKFLPEITVVEVPDDPCEYVRALENLSPFDWKQITEEDMKRIDTYSANKKRDDLLLQFDDYDKYLSILETKVEIGEVNDNNIDRFTQLINKSNQFNLRTKRYSDNAIKKMMNNKENILLYLSLEDKFSTYGIISSIILKIVDDICFIDTWVMSCRALKREIEFVAFKEIIAIAKRYNCSTIIGEYIPTSKNSLVKEHYINLGFKEDNKIDESIIKKEGVLYKRGVEDFEYNAKIFVIRN